MFLKPHITFDGQAEEAINFYKKVFNGEIDDLQRFEDAKADPDMARLDPSLDKRVINARLKFGDNYFSVCDSTPAIQLVQGNNMMMDIAFIDDKEIVAIYNALSEGGKVLMPMSKTYFSPSFAVLVDKFGIKWCLMQLQ